MSCDFQSVERYELPYCSNPKNTAIDVETDVEQAMVYSRMPKLYLVQRSGFS